MYISVTNLKPDQIVSLTACLGGLRERIGHPKLSCFQLEVKIKIQNIVARIV